MTNSMARTAFELARKKQAGLFTRRADDIAQEAPVTLIKKRLADDPPELTDICNRDLVVISQEDRMKIMMIRAPSIPK